LNIQALFNWICPSHGRVLNVSQIPASNTFVDAQEQLKIEKSLLIGHVPILQDMMSERKVKPDMETRRLLNEICNMT